jgi:hypothetical protein
MTVTTLAQSSRGNDRVETAVRLLAQAMSELHAARREADAERERAALNAQRAAEAKRAEAETLRRSRSITLDRGWLERYTDALRTLADEVGRGGQRSHTNQFANLIGALCAELENPERAAR